MKHHPEYEAGAETIEVSVIRVQAEEYVCLTCLDVFGGDIVIWLTGDEARALAEDLRNHAEISRSE